MNKKGLFKSFLICTLAALSFTACGKKKTTTTKENTTTVAPEPEPEPILNSVTGYYSKKNIGVAGIDVRKKDGKLDSVCLVPLVGENDISFPLFIQPIVENNEIKKVKISTFISEEYLSTYYSQVFTLSSDGIEIPTHLLHYVGDSSDEIKNLLMKSENGKLCIYNNKAKMVIDKDANVTTSNFDLATSSYVVDGNTIKYANGVYSSIDKEGTQTSISTDPKNAYLDVASYSPYLKKFVTLEKYEMDITASEPTAKIYSNYYAMMSGSMSSYGGNVIFNEGKLVEVSYANAKLDSNGNITECELGSTMYPGAADKVTFDYSDGKIASVYYSTSDGDRKYAYTYDDKGRVSQFTDGFVYSDGDNKGEYKNLTQSFSKITYDEYNDFGYATQVTSISYDNGGWEHAFRHNYTYNASNLITNDVVQDYNTTTTVATKTSEYIYSYDNNSNVTEITHDNYIAGVKDESNTTTTKYTYDSNNSITKEESYDTEYVDEQYKLYLSSKTEYTSGKDGTEYYYKETTTDYGYSSPHAANYTSEKQYRYIDQEMLCLTKYSETNTDLDSNETRYIMTVIQYNSDKQVTSIKELEKDFSETDPTTNEQTTITYDANKKISKTEHTEGSDSQTDTYDEFGYITKEEIIESGEKTKNEYKYDTNHNVIQVDRFIYIDSISKYIYYNDPAAFYPEPGTYYYTDGNILMPYKVVMYNYDSAYVLASTNEMEYYDNMSSGMIKEMTTTNYDTASSKVEQEIVTTYYNNENNRSHEKTTKDYDGLERIVSEEYYEYSDKATSNLKVYYLLTFAYSGEVKTTTGFKYEYADDGSTIANTYTWNDTTKAWDLDTH